MIQGLRNVFKATEDEIEVIEEADFPTLSALFIRLGTSIFNTHNNGEQKTLVWFYYTGHGVLMNTTYAVCDIAEKPRKAIYMLES